MEISISEKLHLNKSAKQQTVILTGDVCTWLWKAAGRPDCVCSVIVRGNLIA